MRIIKSILSVAGFAVCVGLLGCDRSNDTAPAKTVTSEELKERYKDAASATRDYLAQNKDAFVATMNEKLKELDVKINDLKKKSENYKDDQKSQADKSLGNLRDQRNVVNDQLEKAKAATAEGWEKVKAGLKTAVDDLQNAYEKAKAKFE